eukprot:TRINITY_DN4534_c0_g1_i3.p1 TRINITY_DN4534_c0_g1~~TRINITY_DN4534_c0_g1_i3.p1  ORF type:complete len:301 (-),score=153.64 TRINITY_DN4534_c0_g1_i3:96-998(-)
MEETLKPLKPGFPTPTKEKENEMTAEGWKQFDQALFYIFNTWTALELAVNFNWGGKKSKVKMQNLQDDVLYLFRNKARKHKKVDTEEVEDILLDMMDSLHTIVEDDSVTTVTDLIFKIHKDCLNLDYSEVDTLQGQYDWKHKGGKSFSLAHSVKDQQFDEDDDDGYYEGDFNIADTEGIYIDDEEHYEGDEGEEGEEGEEEGEEGEEVKEEKKEEKEEKEDKVEEKEKKEVEENKEEKNLKEEEEKQQKEEEETKEKLEEKEKWQAKKNQKSSSTSKKKKGRRAKEYDADGWEIVGKRKK